MLLLQACVASSLVEVPQPGSHWECKARDLNLLSAGPGQASILTRESLSVFGEETALVIWVLGMPREECNSRQLFRLVSGQFK